MLWLLFLIALIAALAGWLWPRRDALLRRYRSLRGAHRPRYPIVLAHGVMGFDELRIAGRSHVYFRGVADYLRGQGLTVYVARVDPSSSVAERAAQLAEQVRMIPERRVNIIAHSMGGLDARFAISKLGIGHRVASLITIGTPHHGTPLADHGVSLLGNRLRLRALGRLLGMRLDAFDNLTTEYLCTFNRDVSDAKRVWYGSVVGRAPEGPLTHPVLRPWRHLIQQWTGDNDGLVPVSSQAWGHVVMRVEADHFAQVGWGPTNDPGTIFDPLVRELALRGC